MKYIVGVIAVVIILFAAIFWIVTGNNDREPGQRGKPQIELTEYADSNAKVTYQINGELVAKEEHRAVRITVTRNQRTFEVLSGYDGDVISSKTYPNTSAAFDTFVHGLDIAGFTREKKAKYDSESGVCPRGNTMVYTLTQDNNELSRLWGSSCDKSDGPFGGNRREVSNLFERQIPDYQDLTDDVDL